jgi:hypothetical protein
MIAYVNLGSSGDAFVVVIWPDDVEPRYFISDALFQRWFRWHQARHPAAAWLYISDSEMNALLAESGLTMGDFLPAGKKAGA